jgi:hypothetical protein
MAHTNYKNLKISHIDMKTLGYMKIDENLKFFILLFAFLIWNTIVRWTSIDVHTLEQFSSKI